MRIYRLNDPEPYWPWILFVAMVGRKPVGYCELKMRDTVGNTDVFVVGSHRRGGVGFALKCAAIDYAFKHGVKTMKTAINRQNLASWQNCIKQGYRIVKRYSTKQDFRLHLHKKDWLKSGVVPPEVEVMK